MIIKNRKSDKGANFPNVHLTETRLLKGEYHCCQRNLPIWEDSARRSGRFVQQSGKGAVQSELLCAVCIRWYPCRFLSRGQRRPGFWEHLCILLFPYWFLLPIMAFSWAFRNHIPCGDCKGRRAFVLTVAAEICVNRKHLCQSAFRHRCCKGRGESFGKGR